MSAWKTIELGQALEVAANLARETLTKETK